MVSAMAWGGKEIISLILGDVFVDISLASFESYMQLIGVRVMPGTGDV